MTLPFVYIFSGKVDVSVEVNLHKNPSLKSVKNSSVLAPLELKTGKMFSSLGRCVGWITFSNNINKL